MEHRGFERGPIGPRRVREDDDGSMTDPLDTIVDRPRGSLDRHATYIVAAYLAGAAR